MPTSATLAVDDLRTLVPDWRRHLKAVNRAPATIATYAGVADELAAFLVANGMPTSVTALTREHLEHYLVDLAERPNKRTGKPISAAHVAKHYRHLQQLWRWLETEGEITVNAFAKMSPPAVPVQPVAVLPEDWLKKLLNTCRSNTFFDRRDTALIRFFLDTGCRAGEVQAMEVSEEKLNFELDVAIVMGKGRLGRSVPFGSKTGEALRRYLRKRATSTFAASPYLWLGRSGPLTASGITRIVNRRTAAAGLPHIHPHQFRHTFAHMWLASGGQEVDLMRLMGWKSREMVARYAASAGVERAHAAHRKQALGDRI
ncbi:MAG TPA: tyrosine-type recombinase/integrase [Pseudonocardiaceae bacterium]|nr:tyrosine-type recombinase/integrase [Pseudonocardiaceae bacterium]